MALLCLAAMVLLCVAAEDAVTDLDLRDDSSNSQIIQLVPQKSGCGFSV